MRPHASSDDRTITVMFVDGGLSFGGALVVTTNLIRYLDRARYRSIAVVATDRDSLPPALENVARVYYARPLVHYEHWDRVTGWAARTLPSGWIRAGVMRALSLARVFLNMPYVAKIWMIGLRERAAVVHLSNGIGNEAVNMAALLLGRPCVATLAGIAARRAGTWGRMLCRRPSTTIVAVSDAVLQGYLRFAENARGAVRIYNPCVPPEPDAGARGRSRAKLEFGAADLVFGIFGRITPWKGQLEFLRAAVGVLRELPLSRAVIVGDVVENDVEYGQVLHALVREHGLSDRVVFTGYTADVDAMYAAMDVVVHASIEPEPFGLVITEAMAAGAAVIASPLGGPAEIIEDGVTGLLVDPNDTASLTEAIERLLTDNALRDALVRAASRHVRECYAPDAYARTISALYERLLRPKGSSEAS